MKISNIKRDEAKQDESRVSSSSKLTTSAIIRTAAPTDAQIGTFVWQQPQIQTNLMLRLKMEGPSLLPTTSRPPPSPTTVTFLHLEKTPKQPRKFPSFLIFRMSELDDFLSDSAALFGDAPPDDGTIRYGSLTLTVAPKVCKWPDAVITHTPFLPITSQEGKVSCRLFGNIFNGRVHIPIHVLGQHPPSRSSFLPIVTPCRTHRVRRHLPRREDRY